MKTTRVLLVVGCSVVAVAGLLLAGSRRLAIRTFALDAPNQFAADTLRPGAQVCEGPLQSSGPARYVRVWGSASGKGGRIAVVVEDAGSDAHLATGHLEVGSAAAARTVLLDRPVMTGRTVRVCVRAETSAFTLLGYPAVNSAIVMSGHSTGQPDPKPGYEFSLVLLGPERTSLLGSLKTAFRRASLWRPSWVGSWTFWLLAVAFLATFGVAAAVVFLSAIADTGEARQNREP